MGYDFKPVNKAAGDYHLGAFSWPMMLDSGLGLVLGTGPGFSPGQFIYIKRPDGLCVQYNDGAKVSAKESKELAKVARWIARFENARIMQWQTVPIEERNRMEARNKTEGITHIYKLPWSPDCVQKFLDFAEWSEKSGGFKIH